MQSDPILKGYEKAYKRNYARCSNQKITKEEFRFWIDEAAQKRELASNKFLKTNNPEVIQKFKNYHENK